MHEYKLHLETLRRHEAEAALIRDLAANREKRELFKKIAAHLHTLADEVEQTMRRANVEVGDPT